jgi:hypothetical protein
MNTMKTMQLQFVSVAQAAAVLGVSAGLVYKMRLVGAPGIITVGRSVRVNLPELLKHLKG